MHFHWLPAELAPQLEHVPVPRASGHILRVVAVEKTEVYRGFSRKIH